MTRFLPPALLGIAAGAGLWLGGAQAAAPQSSAHSPGGSTIIRLMLTRTSAIRTLHASGTVNGPAGSLSLTGDCALTVSHTRQGAGQVGTSVLSWVHGFLRHASNTSTVDIHLIEVQAGTGVPQAWSRSPSSGNRWRVAGRGAAVATIYTSDLCLPLMARAGLGRNFNTWKNLGTVTVNGRSAWQVQSRRTLKGISTSVTTIQVDKSTHDFLGYDDTETGLRSHTTSRTVIDYSRFNEKLTIAPPRIGSRTP